MSGDRYSLEVGPQFVYIRDDKLGKRIATVYGNSSQKKERGFMMVDALNQLPNQEEQRDHESSEIYNQ